MQEVHFVTCVLLRYTEIMVNCCLLALKGCTAQLYFLWATYERFWSQKHTIALTVTVCIAFVQGNLWTSKENIASVMCHSVLLEWTNTWTIPASKELSTFVAFSWLSTQSQCLAFFTQESLTLQVSESYWYSDSLQDWVSPQLKVGTMSSSRIQWLPSKIGYSIMLYALPKPSLAYKISPRQC